MPLSGQSVSFCSHIGSYIIKIHAFYSSVLIWVPGLSKLRPRSHAGHWQETGVDWPLLYGGS